MYLFTPTVLLEDEDGVGNQLTFYCYTRLFPGGRFKKEVQLDGQSYLLLIRDEGGMPEAQVSIC